jgi:hypothetical protein
LLYRDTGIGQQTTHKKAANRDSNLQQEISHSETSAQPSDVLVKHKCIMELLCNAANELIRCSKYVDDSSGNSKAVNKNTEQPNGSEISAPVNEDIVISGVIAQPNHEVIDEQVQIEKGDSLNSPNELDRYAGETVVTEQFHIDEVRDLADDNETIEDKTDGNNCKEYACMSEASDKHATEKTQNENSRDSSNELDRYAGATVVTEQFHIDEVRDLADDNETIEDKTDGNNCKEYACMSEASDKHATEKTQNENSRDSSNELDRYAGATVVTEQFHIDEVRDLADDNETIEDNN